MNTKILFKLSIIWSAKPNQRFNQLLDNILVEFDNCNKDRFYLEDEIFEQYLDRFIEENEITT